MRRISLVLLAVVSWSCTEEEEPPHFLWSADAQSLANPFPDERLIVNGTAQLRDGWYEPFFPAEKTTPLMRAYMRRIAEQAKTHVTAFGNFGSTLLPASEPLDPASLRGHVRRLVKDTSGWRVLEADVTVEHPSDLVASAELSYPTGWPEFLATRPSVPMPEGREGLLVVLRGPKTAGGVLLGQGREFTENNTIDQGALKALGVSEEEVIYFQPLRAANVTAPMKKLAAWAEANPGVVTIPAKGAGPVGRWARADSNFIQLNEWLERNEFSTPASHVGTVLIGSFAAKDLREEGHFKPEWVEDPSLAPGVQLQFVAVFPDGPKPTGGWPMVLSQHGVNGRNTPASGKDSYCLQWAEALARRGMGCMGIDAPHHGTRGNFVNFFRVDDLVWVRDNFREMTFDLLQAERVMVTLDADGDGEPDVAQTTRYFGTSLGGIMGANFIPFGNRLTSAGLSVPGGGLTNLLMSYDLHDLIGFLVIAQTDIEYGTPEFYMSFSLVKAAAQPFFDSGDPINVAQALSPQVALLQQNGRNDYVIPNDTNFDLKNAYGLADAAPATGDVPLRAFQFIDGADYGKPPGFNGHDYIWQLEGVRNQMLEFLQSDGRTLIAP